MNFVKIDGQGNVCKLRSWEPKPKPHVPESGLFDLETIEWEVRNCSEVVELNVDDMNRRYIDDLAPFDRMQFEDCYQVGNRVMAGCPNHLVWDWEGPTAPSGSERGKLRKVCDFLNVGIPDGVRVLKAFESLGLRSTDSFWGTLRWLRAEGSLDQLEALASEAEAVTGKAEPQAVSFGKTTRGWRGNMTEARYVADIDTLGRVRVRAEYSSVSHRLTEQLNTYSLEEPSFDDDEPDDDGSEAIRDDEAERPFREYAYRRIGLAEPNPRTERHWLKGKLAELAGDPSERAKNRRAFYIDRLLDVNEIIEWEDRWLPSRNPKLMKLIRAIRRADWKSLMKARSKMGRRKFRNRFIRKLIWWELDQRKRKLTAEALATPEAVRLFAHIDRLESYTQSDMLLRWYKRWERSFPQPVKDEFWRRFGIKRESFWNRKERRILAQVRTCSQENKPETLKWLNALERQPDNGITTPQFFRVAFGEMKKR